MALTALAAALIFFHGRITVPSRWLLFVGLAASVVTAQAFTGYISFLGDAWMALLYLAAFVGALAIGRSLVDDGRHSAAGSLNPLAISTVFAATASVGLAAVQWTSAVDLSLWSFEIARNTRPAANVGQPNHFSTICLLGVVALGWLRHHGRIGAIGFWVGSTWMLVGIVMSASRTGLLQIAFLSVFMLTVGARAGLPLSRPAPLLLPLILGGLLLLWPHLSEILMLDEIRSSAESASTGTRPLHWQAMWAALLERPILGFGWQQVSLAQLSVADRQPFVGEFIEHSHNIVLDLLVWNGLPIGLLLVGLSGGWFVTRIVACRDGQAAWLLAGACGLLIHGLLEYPLEYSYFLIPFGVLIGGADGLIGLGRAVAIPTALTRTVGALLTLTLLVVGSEYFKAEQGLRTLRLESARIGVSGIQTPPPDLRVLTQLLAFQRFIHTEARPGMSAYEVAAMRRVSERYSQPSALLRYALVAGLNGDLPGAAVTLIRLCRIHEKARCKEAAEGWATAQRKYPVLLAVPPPAPPV